MSLGKNSKLIRKYFDGLEKNSKLILKIELGKFS
jgi:hypothetical protein